jgi:nitrogen fixation NifU-like protein
LVVQYSPELIDHYKNPRNMGEMAGADVSATVGNPTCGDVVTIFLKFDGDRISDAGFQTYGCGPCVALSSMVTEKVKGMSLDEAYGLTIEEFTRKYPELPRNKLHCTNLVVVALRKAIDIYMENRKEKGDNHG